MVWESNGSEVEYIITDRHPQIQKFLRERNVVQAPGKVCKVIKACAVLHNICKARQIADPPEDSQTDEEDDDQYPPQGYLHQSGMPYRAQFTTLHFGDGVGAAEGRE